MEEPSNELKEFIYNEAKLLGFKLVNILVHGHNKASIEVILDKEGGITLAECSDFNKRLQSWIYETSLYASGYVLDVCSPGLDRTLKSESEFLWAVGKQIEVRTYEAIQGEKAIIGKLLEAGEKKIVVKELNEHVVSIERNNIAKARLKVK